MPARSHRLRGGSRGVCQNHLQCHPPARISRIVSTLAQIPFFFFRGDPMTHPLWLFALQVPLLAAAATGALAQQAVVTPVPGLPSAINVPNSSVVGVNNAGHFVGLTNLYGFDPASGISYPGV